MFCRLISPRGNSLYKLLSDQLGVTPKGLSAEIAEENCYSHASMNCDNVRACRCRCPRKLKHTLMNVRCLHDVADRAKIRGNCPRQGRLHPGPDGECSLTAPAVSRESQPESFQGPLAKTYNTDEPVPPLRTPVTPWSISPVSATSLAIAGKNGLATVNRCRTSQGAIARGRWSEEVKPKGPGSLRRWRGRDRSSLQISNSTRTSCFFRWRRSLRPEQSCAGGLLLREH